ncbi:MAG: HprK-related kinase B [gamma proteobacterium symbiont of Bathyaustriella thionipta]|nr:HprK-related kinase B [gamma proteobacterium symbiont of Bathyaustriella thionipta]
MNVNTAADLLIDGAQLTESVLYLQFGDCKLRLNSNSDALIQKLQHYFAHVVSPPADPDIDIIAIERDAPQLDIAFTDWQREAGKSGRKDSYFDFPDGRLIRKVRTGMVFLQSKSQSPVAAGPCLHYDNQVINFINAQYMNWLQQRDWLICHASGLVHNGQTLAIAGFSGGGKSTLMLNMLENPQVSYLTNDRLFIQPEGSGCQAAGIPKLPRINPGTILHNERLLPLIPPQQRASLLALPKAELWELEQKYDVFINELYGPQRIVQQAPLGAFLVLNWQRDSQDPLQLQAVSLAERPDLLAAIMKSPGPFYQYADGHFFQDDTPFDEAAYLQALADIPVYEASGAIDFDQLAQRCLDELTGNPQ